MPIHRTNCGVAILIVNPENFPVKLDSTVTENRVADRTIGEQIMKSNSPGTSQALLDGVVAVIRQQVISDMQAAEPKTGKTLVPLLPRQKTNLRSSTTTGKPG